LINPTAVIDTTANLGQGVSVGHYSIIGANVELGDDTWIGPHVVIKGPTRIGRSNKIFQFSSIGDNPQDKKYKDGSESILEIGDGNVIREYCSINRGTQLGGGRTVIGNYNWIMANVHIAHDCIVGNQTIFANYSALAGHVKIDDFVIMGGYSGVHQFCHVGRNCFTAVASVVVKDVPPFLMVSGNTAKPCGLNREGLKRNGYSKEAIEQLRKAYKILYRKGLTTDEALKELKSLASESEEVACFVEFIEKSERGIVR